jgi:hypothetical protein
VLLSLLNRENKADLKIDNNMLNNNAVKKPETAKSSINLSANNIIMALITKRNKPKVTRVAGSVKKIKRGLTNIFSKEIIRATIIADT